MRGREEGKEGLQGEGKKKQGTGELVPGFVTARRQRGT